MLDEIEGERSRKSSPIQQKGQEIARFPNGCVDDNRASVCVGVEVCNG